MMRQIRNREIRERLERNNGNVHQTAIGLGLTWKTVRDARDGKRPEPRLVKEKEICVCCGERERDKGLKRVRLCREGWETGESGMLWENGEEWGVSGIGMSWD